MFPKPYQQAWFHGLPGYDIPGGVPVEVASLIPPKPDTRNLMDRFVNWLSQLWRPRRPTISDQPKLNVTIMAAPDLKASLRELSTRKTVVPRLSLVIRTDPQKEVDYEYQMADAIIESSLPLDNPPGATVVNISCSRIASKLALTGNPGPPTDAPEIRDPGSNTGWIFGMFGDRKRGISFDVVNFTPPCFDGQLTVRFGESRPEIQRLLQARKPLPELILVLPDRTRMRYSEFKLRKVRTSLAAESDRQQVVFESDTIEQFTG